MHWHPGQTVATLRSAIEKFGLHYRSLWLICDGGSENQGAVYEFFLVPGVDITRIVAQIDVSFSNSMAEAVNKTIKYGFLYRQPIRDLAHLCKYLEQAVHQYNHRFHSALQGYTPHEVLHGAVPYPRMFSPQIAQARAGRIETNRLELCQKCL